MILKEISAKGSFDNLHNMKWRVSMRIGKELSRVSETDEVISKEISHESFLKLLEDSSKEESHYTVIPELPRYYLKGGVTANKDNFWVILSVPAGKHQYVNGNIGKAYSLPYPALIFALRVNKGVAVDRQCYAVKSTDIVGDDTLLYKYPYGHVSEQGQICMGNCSNQIKSINKAGDFVETFFLGRDLGHYYVEGVWAKPELSIGDLVEKVNEKGIFPDEWLMPNGKKLSDIVKNFTMSK